MSYLDSMQSVVQGDPQLQGLVEEVEQAASLVLLILAALQLGRAIAVKVVEEILNERGQSASSARNVRRTWRARACCREKY